MSEINCKGCWEIGNNCGTCPRCLRTKPKIESDTCPFASAVSDKIKKRAEIGFKKYGVTCEREDLNLSDWLEHLQEELMDAAVYIERARYEIWKEKEKS